ncbi:hypothetical protein Aperf_G00000045351 [Anoplocephala perfoliata]
MDPVVVEACPKDWAAALSDGKVTDLQKFVVGGEAPESWPGSLKDFATQCVTLTQELIQSATNTPPMIDHSTPHESSSGVLFLNDSSGYLFYQCQPEKAVPKKVKPKKHHETEIMSAFLSDLLQSSARFSETRFVGEKMTTFQTASFEAPQPFNHLRPVYLPLLASALVDLGSGLGHLPRRVMKRLKTRSSDMRCVAVEADPELHAAALKLESKEPVPERCLIRVLTRIEKSYVEEFKEEKEDGRVAIFFVVFIVVAISAKRP